MWCWTKPSTQLRLVGECDDVHISATRGYHFATDSADTEIERADGTSYIAVIVITVL